MSAWAIEPGTRTKRAAVHERYGGSNGRGISAPAEADSPGHITLWWDPAGGHNFGYRDGFSADGRAFTYSGMGVRGDQSYRGHTPENARVRDHVAAGDTVRLFRKHGKNDHEYVGELRLVDNRYVDSEDQDGAMRRMIEFEFEVVDSRTPANDEYAPATAAGDEGGPAPLPEAPAAPGERELEAMKKKSFARTLGAWKRQAERRESQLVHDFADWLEATHGLKVTGYEIPHSPAGRPLVGDAYVGAHETLIEAKANTSREALRMALGQLLDYSRFMPEPTGLATLTPKRPTEDMLELLRSHGVSSIWRVGKGFEAEGVVFI